MLIKKLLNWNDRKFDGLLDNDDNDFVTYSKAFGCGALEGFIDAAAIVGAVVIIKDTIGLVKRIFKR